jgi:hypothetical protein
MAAPWKMDDAQTSDTPVFTMNSSDAHIGMEHKESYSQFGEGTEAYPGGPTIAEARRAKTFEILVDAASLIAPVGRAGMGAILASEPSEVEAAIKAPSVNWIEQVVKDLLPHNSKAFTATEGMTERQKEALKLYMHAPAPFQPRIKQQKAALEHAVNQGHFTKEQAANVNDLRSSLNTALSTELKLPGPIYRGLSEYHPDMKIGDIIGGDSPASFGHHPASVVENFQSSPEYIRKVSATPDVMLQVPANSLVRGVVPNKDISGKYAAESEVLLHPDNKLVIQNIEDKDNRKIVTAMPVKNSNAQNVKLWSLAPSIALSPSVASTNTLIESWKKEKE